MILFDEHIEIDGTKIGPGEPLYIIAEMGLMHEGSLEKAAEIIVACKEAGANAVKTQHFVADNLVSESSREGLEWARKNEVPDTFIRDIASICDDVGIIFLCTPHEPSVLDFLDLEIKVPAFKIGSGEHRNYPFITEIARRGSPIIMSTGLHNTLKDIQNSIGAVGAGDCRLLAVLHCISEYPTPIYNLQMSVMDGIRSSFSGPVGFSDHTSDGEGSYIAVAKGADIIERHVMAECDEGRRDFTVSTHISDLADFYLTLRNIHAALGKSERVTTGGEQETARWAEKSFVSTCYIAPGDIITEEMVTVKRPGKGIPPSAKDRVIGKVASKGIPENRVIIGLEDQQNE